MFTVYAATPEDMGPGDIGAHARRAESMGFDGLQVPDAIHDGLLLAAMALASTTRLKVFTGVLLAFPRSPMTTAIAAWDLQKMSGGRFMLGLGTQVKANIIKRYSARWDSPVPQLREYMQALRAIFQCFQNGDPLNFVGEHYQLTKLQPFFNPGPIDHPELPLIGGAVGPAMTRMVGRIADGMVTHPTNTPPRYIREVCLPRLQAGFEQSDDPEAKANSFRLILAPLTATGKDEASVDKEWEKLRQMLGFLYSTPAYWPSLELFGWADKGQQLLDMTRNNDWQRMPEIVSDDMLNEFVPRGSYASIASELAARYSGLSKHITFPMPDDPADDAAAATAIAALKGQD